MFAILAHLGAGWSIGQLLIAAVVIAAAVALEFVAFRQMGVEPPAWVIQVFWIVVVCAVVVFAIRLVLGM